MCICNLEVLETSQNQSHPISFLFVGHMEKAFTIFLAMLDKSLRPSIRQLRSPSRTRSVRLLVKFGLREYPSE